MNNRFYNFTYPEIDDKPVISAKEIKLMKTGAGIINTSRGGLIDEDILMFSLEKKLAYAALDVFSNEPTPSIHLLMQENISLTPHIGAATREAQERVGIELAEKIIKFYNKKIKVKIIPFSAIRPVRDKANLFASRSYLTYLIKLLQKK